MAKPKDYYNTIKKGLDKLSNYTRKYRNCIPINNNEGESHLRQKFNICRQLKKLGYEFFVEAKFKNGGRADIYIPYLDIVIEVLDSEKELSLSKNYPVKKIVSIDASELIKDIGKKL